MDRSLREMGSTDTGVGIRVKNMAQAFYGRQKAYKDCMGETGMSEAMLAEALKRNIYREKPVAPDILTSLAAYAGRNYLALKKQPFAALQNGIIHFSS